MAEPTSRDEFTGTGFQVVSQTPSERIFGRAFVEVHRHDGRKYELTPWCQTATWTPQIREPWTTIDVQAIIPWAQRDLVPRIGDWIVIRSLARTPYAWGVVASEPEPGIEGGGSTPSALASAAVTIRAVSWLRYLREAQLFASPYAIAGRASTIGTYFSGDDWIARIASLQSAIATGQLGAALVQALPSFARLRLPPTLGGGFLGDAVTVVYDDASALQARLEQYRCDAVRGPRIMGVQSYFPDSTNALDFLLGIFVPDKQLIEFWETLAPLRPESQATANALGAFPALIYRIAPFRTQSLGSWLSAQDLAAKVSSIALAPLSITPADSSQDQSIAIDVSSEATLAQPDPALLAAYSAPSWVPSKGVALDYDRDGVNFPTPMRSDSERVNVVTVGLPTQPDSPIRFWKQAGLPFADWASVERYGVRLYQPNWPYFPPSATKARANSVLGSAAQQGAAGAVQGAGSAIVGAPSLVGTLRGIAGLAAMMFLGVERYLRGQIIAGYGRPDVRVGLPVTLAWPSGNRFVAYLDAAQNRVSFNGPQGQTQGQTAFTYSRGAWNPPAVREAPARLPVFVETTTPPITQRTPTPQATQAATGERTSNRNVLFAGGEIPWQSPFSLDRWLLTKPLGNRVRRPQAQITQGVLHYTDGAVTSLTATGTYATFNVRPETTVAAESNGQQLPQSTIHVGSTARFGSTGSFTLTVNGVANIVNYRGKTSTSFTGCTGGSGQLVTGQPITSPGVDSHFIIEANGGVVQVLDLAITAYQAGVSVVNRQSVGIDFVCPQLIDRPAAIAPWQYKTGYTLVPSPNTTSRRFFAPTALQIASARALAIWCNRNLAVPLVAPAATGDPKTVRYYAGAWPPGFYHHAEVYKGRQDCLGIYIPTDIL